MTEEIEESKFITKWKLKALGFKALWQDNPDLWWECCPPHVLITINYTNNYVRYCFDFPCLDYHPNDYYEHGPEAVRAAKEKYFREEEK